MTLQTDIIGDSKYTPVLDHGFVGIVDTMGSDSAIVQAARVSYGDGTKTVREDRGLIRYLIRHKHTSPVEMCEVKLHIRMPIFVMRQWVRHRTASLNEYSGRYSIMSDEFYVPATSALAPQSSDNKQGRNGTLLPNDAEQVQAIMREVFDDAYEAYDALRLSSEERPGPELEEGEGYWDRYSELSNEYPGVAREIARNVLPVSNYTEVYWKQNLHNFFHLVKLRTDPHAQLEIRQFAQAAYDLVRPHFPAACEAFDDYVIEAKSFSRMEYQLLMDLLAPELLDRLPAAPDADFLDHYGFTAREFAEFKGKLGIV